MSGIKVRHLNRYYGRMISKFDQLQDYRLNINLLDDNAFSAP